MSQIQSIADRAMLVRMTIRRFSAAKTDKKVTKEVADNHNADQTMGNYRKNLISKDPLKEIALIESNTRLEYYRVTLPWDQDGSRILTSDAYFKFAEYMRAQQAKWDEAVEVFIANWDSHVADAKVKLNGLFNPADYPDKTRLRRKFAIEWDVRPVPTAADFRVNLGADEIAKVKSQIEASVQATVDNAMQDVWKRLQSVVQKMSERLKAYDPQNPGVHSFRDSLVTNIAEMLELVPSLNLTGDANVARFCDDIRAGLIVSPQALRDSDATRNDVARRADEILAKMEAFIA